MHSANIVALDLGSSEPTQLFAHIMCFHVHPPEVLVAQVAAATLKKIVRRDKK